MKIIKAYTSGLSSAAGSKKMVTLIYAVTFLLALVLAIPFQSALKNEVGNTMALQSLLKDFDYTAYSDFMHNSRKVINTFLSAAVWFGFFYLIFTVFFSGGVLKILSGEHHKFSIKPFLASCGEYFFRFLRLAIYLVILQFIALILVYAPFRTIINAASKTVESEATLVYLFLTGVFVYAIIFVLLLIIGDYTKIILFKNDSRKVIKNIWQSVRFVFRHLFSTYILYLLLLETPLVLFILYFWLDNIIGMVSGLTIFIMFLIQQIFVWSRVWIKIWILGSEIDLYDELKILEINPVATKEIKQTSIQDESVDILNNPAT